MKSQETQWLLSEKYGGTESAAFRADVQLLKNGTPLAYLIGSIPFLDTAIYLESHPLIPRSETEFWTEHAITAIKKSPEANRSNLMTEARPKSDDLGLASVGVHILDLCAGSGAIGIAVAKALPSTHVTFGEIDPAHLTTIQKNIEKNLIIYDKIRYPVVQSDLFENITGTFDFILTNPPYIDPAIDRAEASVKMHEPHLALYGGQAGMECIERIITESPKHLTNKGQFWIEHEPEQSAAIQSLAKQHGFGVTTHKDQYDVERYSVLVLQ